YYRNSEEEEYDVEDDVVCIQNELRHAENKNTKRKSQIKEYEDKIHKKKKNI
ncbi:hypothetical protein KI387_023772, partial [Taxus chinensis]